MLAASPSLSPSTFKYSASGNGQRSKSVHSSYSSSPRFAGTGSPKGTPSSTNNRSAASPPLPLRPQYRDASTQYSPMSDILQEPKFRAPAKTETDNVEHERSSRRNVNGTPPLAASHTTTINAAQSQLAAAAKLPVSPGAKRRQFKESVDLGSSSPKAQPSAPKRPKPTQTAPKVLPLRYELCDVEDMVILIADMISELIETNDNLPLRDVVLTRFHSRTPPGISVLDYLQRLAKHAALTPPLLLSMVYYIDRLCSLYPAFTITTLTVHRFLITAATVAAKGLSDSFWNNSTYARVGGIKLAELGLLELELLYRVDWRIVPKPETLVEYYHGLVGRTDAYVLESEDSSGNAQALNPLLDTNVAKGPETDHDGTDTKWDEWMKDVADLGNK